MKQPGLDLVGVVHEVLEAKRHRDKDGEIRKKNRNTLVRTLRKE